MNALPHRHHPSCPSQRYNHSLLCIFVVAVFFFTGCTTYRLDADRAVRISEIATYGALDIAEVQGVSIEKLERARESARLLFERMNEILLELQETNHPSSVTFLTPGGEFDKRLVAIGVAHKEGE